MISVCGLPLGVFLAFYERERLQSGLGLASFLCFAIFFEFGEPEPGWVGLPLIATRCGCVETLLRLVKPAMPVIWPAWILCSLLHRSFSVQSQVCLGARRMSSDARRIILRGSAPAKLWDRVGICAAIAARGLARRLRRARVSALPVTQLESAPPRSFAGAFSLFFRRHS